MSAETVTPDYSWYNDHKTDAVYNIDDVADLLGFQKLVNDEHITFAGKTVKLRNNIDLSGIEWTPIDESFAGKFNGDRFTISCVKIDTDQDYSGFFEGIAETAVVKNLNIEGVVINSEDSSSIGGVVGNNKGKVYSCSMNGTVSNTGINGKAGGVVGISSGSIRNCYCLGSVSSKCKSGGIVGKVEYNSGADVINCYSAVTLTGPMKGGIIGGNNGCDVQVCYYLSGSAKKGAGNLNEDKTTYALPLSQMKAKEGESSDGTWINNAGIVSSYIQPLVHYLNDYVDIKDTYGEDLLLRWEMSSETGFPRLVSQVKETNVGYCTPCVYNENLDSAEDVTLILGGKEAGKFYLEKNNDNGFSIKDSNDKYLNFDSETKTVSAIDNKQYWQYDGGLYIETETAYTGIKKLFNKTGIKTKYYLTQNDGKWAVSTNKVSAQKQVKSDSHPYTYRDNEDGKTHTMYCIKCGKIFHDDSEHYKSGDCCCGYCPKYYYVNKVEVTMTESFKLRFFKRIGQYTYTIKWYVNNTRLKVNSIKYRLYTNMNWNEGTGFTSESKLNEFYICITDMYGSKTYWKYTGDTTATQYYE